MKTYMIPVRGFVTSAVGKRAAQAGIFDMGANSLPSAIGWYKWYMALPPVRKV